MAFKSWKEQAEELNCKINSYTRNMTVWEIIFSRQERDWEAFDKMKDIEKLECRLNELRGFFGS